MSRRDDDHETTFEVGDRVELWLDEGDFTGEVNYVHGDELCVEIDDEDAPMSEVTMSISWALLHGAIAHEPKGGRS